MKKYALLMGIAMLLFMVSCEKEEGVNVELEIYQDDPKKSDWDKLPYIIDLDSALINNNGN